MIETNSGRYARDPRLSPRRSQAKAELIVAVTVIGAATLATFLALFITSRPFDPATASLPPQQSVPAAPTISPSPKPSASITPQANPTATQPPAPAVEVATPVDDATIQAHIDSTLANEPSFSSLDVSTLVENGKVTIVGSVKSTEMKLRVGRAIRAIKGVTEVDNQLVITETTP